MLSSKAPVKGSRRNSTTVEGPSSAVVPGPGEAEEAFTLSTDPMVNKVQRQIMSVFEVFDQSGQQTVDVREVGTMCRALDLCPTEADVHEIIECVEESSTKGVVKMNTFVNHMTKIICDGKYRPILFEEILNALRGMDKDNKGFLDAAEFKEILMREGEAFTAEEADEMFNFAVEKKDNMIHYEDYADKLYRGFGPSAR